MFMLVVPGRRTSLAESDYYHGILGVHLTLLGKHCGKASLSSFALRKAYREWSTHDDLSMPSLT
jgi:hypothetical protein